MRAQLRNVREWDFCCCSRAAAAGERDNKRGDALITSAKQYTPHQIGKQTCFLFRRQTPVTHPTLVHSTIRLSNEGDSDRHKYLGRLRYLIASTVVGAL